MYSENLKLLFFEREVEIRTDLKNKPVELYPETKEELRFVSGVSDKISFFEKASHEEIGQKHEARPPPPKNLYEVLVSSVFCCKIFQMVD